MTGHVGRLRALDSCAVSDARDRLGLGDTTVVGVHDLTGHQRVAGSVTTVLLGPVTSSIPARHLCTEAIEASGPDHVIVVDHQGRSDAAGWGGNLSRAARRRGVPGTLVFGAARDVDEARELAFPVYATSATPRTARGRAQEHAWNEEVSFAGVAVRPGDFVLADASGIVFVPADEIDAVLEEAERIASTEAEIAEAIETGTPVTAAMSGDYERMTTPRRAAGSHTGHDNDTNITAGGPRRD